MLRVESIKWKKQTLGAKKDIRLVSATNSVITDHKIDSGHDFGWKDYKILSKESNYFTRNIAEMLHIKVVVVPKISLWKKKFFYDFKTGNYIIRRVIYKERHSF